MVVSQTDLSLDSLTSRTESTREIRKQHVAQLAESIAVLGLLEPLVVDRRGTVLAGRHRLAAIRWLQQEDPSAFEQHFPEARVPVRVIDIDAEEDLEMALQIEVTENEKRRDYTAKEIREIATRLRSAGYVDKEGRPAKGEKALRPALAVICGKSLRMIRRYLNEDSPKTRTGVRLSSQAKQVPSYGSMLGQLQGALLSWVETCEQAQIEISEALRDSVHELLDQIQAEEQGDLEAEPADRIADPSPTQASESP